MGTRYLLAATRTSRYQDCTMANDTMEKISALRERLLALRGHL